jgi:hypothetical protein
MITITIRIKGIRVRGAVKGAVKRTTKGVKYDGGMAELAGAGVGYTL